MVERERKLVYPPGVRDITEDISTDDLVRRLKDCAQAFQSMSQDDDNSAYIPLALHLASETFLEHPSRDVRSLVACCIADVFRVYAPEAPYKDPSQLKIIFEFFVDQLRGLEDNTKPTFKRYFYLLENFSCVKTFNICVELDDNQNILCRLFKLMFKIINENHSVKVKKFMLDMLSPLISESDVVSQELLDIILVQIVEPIKSKNTNACSLAQDILNRNIVPLEPYIQNFFNNALILGKTLQSEVARHLYELIYELNAICPTLLVVVLPQLEFKLKSNEEKERLDVTTLLARMFSDPNSTMIVENKLLWSCFLQRFNDISPQVRIRCIHYCKHFLLNHSEAKEDITEQLKQRSRDVDENVRFEAVSAIVNAAKEDFSSINEELLKCVKERTLDKKFKIRKEALTGLAVLYRQHIKNSDLAPADLESISWIKNKVLHAYYQTSLEDRMLVEKILHTCLVPYQSPMEDRMKLLYKLFCSADDNAVKSFKEIMKCQSVLRSHMKNIIDIIQSEKSDQKQKLISTKVSMLAKNLPENSKTIENIQKFCGDLDSNSKLLSMMSFVVSGDSPCSEVEQKVKEILKLLGHPVQTNNYYVIIKQLLERIAPVMLDREGIGYLVSYVKDSLLGSGVIEAELNLENSARRGLELLWVLTFVFQTAFQDEEIYSNLMQFLKVEDDVCTDTTLQIFMNICNEMELKFPSLAVRILPILENFAETGNVKQAKHAIYCINSIVIDREKVFGKIIDNLKKHFTLKSQYFRSALVSVGHIAYLCHDMFAADFKTIVAKIVVKDLLMLDQVSPPDLPRGGDETWGPLDSLPDETKVKIEGMKVMVRWLAGLKDMVQPAMSTLRLLTTVIMHDGDLMERQHTAPVENSWMRLSAANCMLKLCQEPNYANVITVDQYQTLAFVITDHCPEVRDRFAQKVYKGLYSMKLPLEFLAVFCLGAIDERKEFRNQIKSYLIANINKRKEFIKQRVFSQEKLRTLLPDYSLPYAVYLLAHSPELRSYDDVAALRKLKECLWFLMEPLMVKNENYSFSFFKRLLDNIKQTKDRQGPDDDDMNKKLYAVCDLALSIVISKTTNFVLKEFPVEPSLPSKLFTDTDTSYSNMKTYLPPELICDNHAKTGIEIQAFDGGKTSHENEKVEDSNIEDSNVQDSNVQEPNVQDSNVVDENSSSISKEKTISKKTTSEKTTSEKTTSEKTTSEKTSEEKRTSKRTLRSRPQTRRKNKEKNDVQTPVSSENSNPDKDSINSEVSQTLSETASDSTISQLPQMKEAVVQLKPLRSVRLNNARNEIKSNDTPKTNGTLPSDSSVSSLCTPEVQSLLKECNVSLRKDEVERYTTSTDSSVVSPKFPSHKNASKISSKQNGIRKSLSDINKRKRENSPVSRSVRSKTSTRSSERSNSTFNSPRSTRLSKSSTSTPKSLLKNTSPLKKAIKKPLMNGNQSKKISNKLKTPVKKASEKIVNSHKRSQRNEVRNNLRKR